MEQHKKKRIAVVGATGYQGHSVVESLVKNGWKVRALVRDASSECSRKLKTLGGDVEVVEGNLNDSREELEKFFKDCHGAFAVTTPFERENEGKEKEQGIKLAEAAHRKGVQHYVYSSLPNVEKITNGKYDVPHFTDKAKVAEHISTHLKFPKFTCFSPAFYYQNFQNIFKPKKEDDGTLVFRLPEVRRLTMFSVCDTGPCVAKIFAHPEECNRKCITTVGHEDSLKNIITLLGKESGQKLRLETISKDEYVDKGICGGKHMAEMFLYIDEYGYYGPKADHETGRKICPDLSSFQDWAKNDWTVNTIS
jgi:uncharacterized protein YbjT (DUF2867 family)